MGKSNVSANDNKDSKADEKAVDSVAQAAPESAEKVRLPENVKAPRPNLPKGPGSFVRKGTDDFECIHRGGGLKPVDKRPAPAVGSNQEK
jgi:hypothetical protein